MEQDERGAGGAPTGFGQQMTDLTGGGAGSVSPTDDGPRVGVELTEAAAVSEPQRDGGASLTPPEQDLLTATYMGAAEKPGAKAAKSYDVRFADGKVQTFKLHPISYARWRYAQKMATDAETGETDAYKAASWIVAYGLLEPKLGPMVAAARQREDGPQDAPALLRDFFEHLPGGLTGLSARVVELSGLGMATEVVVEAEAAKT